VLTLKSLLAGLSVTALCLLLIDAHAPTAAAAAAAPAENPAQPTMQGTMRGKILFLRCASCHDLTTARSAKIGPNLDGVVGRQVASLDGFNYSMALKSQNFVWDAARLDAWLKNPNTVAPGTAMAFAGIPEAADRQAIISYLGTRQGAAQ
jgi:cytochrome c